MKLLIFCLLIFSSAFVQAERDEFHHGILSVTVNSPRLGSTRKILVENTILQNQDNFDPVNKNTWNMSYLENNEFARTGGPLFIVLESNLEEISDNDMKSSLIYEMAKEHHAALFYVQNRYLGKNSPTNDVSVQNLRKYLNNEQILADVASFITRQKEQKSYADSKVVVFGTFINGNLATWMRLKYPHLVHAAVAYSAPVFVVNIFFQYQYVISKVLDNWCSSELSKGFYELEQMIRNGSRAQVIRDLNFCYNAALRDENDVNYLFYQSILHILKVVQYSTAENNNVYNMCEKILFPTKYSPYKRLTSYLKTNMNCITNYDLFIKSVKNDKKDMAYYHQQCTEFGYMMTSYSLFGNSLNSTYYAKLCKDLFGSEYGYDVITKGTQLTNQKYGGQRPSVTRVVATYGSKDPWSVLGMYESKNSTAPVYYIKGAYHAEDTTKISSSDSNELRQAKNLVKNSIKEWLSLQ